MPLLNIRLILIVVIVSVICISRTSIREQVLLNSYRKMLQMSVYQPSEQDLFEGALEGMAEKLRSEKYNDHYTYYENYTELQDTHNQLDSNLVGIGVFLDFNEKEETLTLFPLPDSPALRAGVRHGDLLLKVNSEEIKGLTSSDLAKKIQGPEGTDVTLTVKHRDAETPQDVVVMRERQQVPNVIGDRLNEDGGWNFTLETDPHIGYVAIYHTFGHNTAKEVAQALVTINRDDIEGVIIDLRGNPGGYLDAATQICELFLNGGVIVSIEERHNTRVYEAHGSKAWDKPVVVLVDGGSASASEIVAACLQDHGVATVIGSRSYGKGTVQEMIELPLKLGGLRLTKARYLRPSQKNINRKDDAKEDDEWGVTPNEGYALKLSKPQMRLTYGVRQLRSVVPTEELQKNVDDLVQYIKEVDATKPNDDTDDKKPKSDGDKTSDKEPKQPFEPQGNSPYYDPQLDMAIRYFEDLK